MMATLTAPSSSPASDDDQAAAQAIQSCWRQKRKRDIAKEAAQATAKALTTKREAGVLPKAVLDLIEKIENEGAANIFSIKVVRTPVQEYVSHLMQIISIGKYKEAIAESPYDGMFHLSILLNGRYILQKNEVIALSDGADAITEKSETMVVDIPLDVAQQLTFTTLLEHTERHMGPANFTNYCAKSNNCQDFILAILQGNGLATPELESFVKQDAEGIFNQLPVHTAPVAKALTDSAAVANKLAEDIMVKGKQDYSSILKEFKSKVPEDRLEEAHKLMIELKLSASEAKALLKSDQRKRDKFSGGLRMLREKARSREKENGGTTTM
jgi:hypothetical protein